MKVLRASFCFPVRGVEAGLPTAESRFVLEQEPDEDVDAWDRFDRVPGLLHVLGLLGGGDADQLVGWVGLVAVFADPESGSGIGAWRVRG